MPIPNLPKWDAAKQTYIRPHIAIDPATGAAQDDHLFYRHYVPKGAQFTVKACWLGSADEFRNRVVPLLNRAAGRFGFPLGKASRAGFGRVQLVSDQIISGTVTKLAQDGDLPTITTSDFTQTLVPTDPASVETLTLHCEGPFLIHDPTRHEGEFASDLMGFQRDRNIPELLGTSLLGALRSRASWLQQLMMGLCPDDRNAKYTGDFAALTPTQRIFGMNGWAKRIRILDIEMTDCRSHIHTYPGLALDDFTQANIDGATFSIKAPGNVTFQISYTLDKQGWCDEDDKLLAHLCADIAENGLKIGHSTGIGFGWFRVPETPQPAGDAPEQEAAHG
jgi:CRISPR/Cas system CSM-associated protein Csm3 (group 7 of RAMP superfamily)